VLYLINVTFLYNQNDDNANLYCVEIPFSDKTKVKRTIDHHLFGYKMTITPLIGNIIGILDTLKEERNGTITTRVMLFGIVPLSKHIERKDILYRNDNNITMYTYLVKNTSYLPGFIGTSLSETTEVRFIVKTDTIYINCCSRPRPSCGLWIFFFNNYHKRQTDMDWIRLTCDFKEQLITPTPLIQQ